MRLRRKWRRDAANIEIKGIIMGEYNYEQIKEVLSKWGQVAVWKCLKKQDQMEITKDNQETLIMDFTFDFCLSQLIVSKPIFAPYKNVSFEAMSLDSEKAKESGKPELIYFFYDEAGMSESNVIYEVEKGVRFCSNYKPDVLKEVYLNKYGVINFKKDEPGKGIHPDDINKVEKICLYQGYICIDTFAQYLVLNNGNFTIRVLPEIFYL